MILLLESNGIAFLLLLVITNIMLSLEAGSRKSRIAKIYFENRFIFAQFRSYHSKYHVSSLYGSYLLIMVIASTRKKI